MQRSGINKQAASLTSYDLLKSLAFLTMVSDHVGYFLFPDQIAWRLIGRMSMPLWLFLVGYARSREIDGSIIVGALLLVASDVVFAYPIFPVNILFTIILVRLFLEPVMTAACRSTLSFCAVILVLGVFMWRSADLFEYGSHCFLFAMLGYLARRRGDLSCPPLMATVLPVVAFVIHAVTQSYLFEANAVEAVLTGVAILASMVILHYFRPMAYPHVLQGLWSPIRGGLKLMGRHSLELYVLHLWVLKAAAAHRFWDAPRYFEWTWF